MGAQRPSRQPGRQRTFGLASCIPTGLRHDRFLLACARPVLAPDPMLPAGAGSPRRPVVVFRGSPRGRTVIPGGRPGAPSVVAQSTTLGGCA
jgi:hypothetical protein